MRTILIADDSENCREIARTALEHAGHRVVEARDGVEALTVASEVQPDLIILDLRMPGLTGLEAMARLRNGPAFATPVIAATAFAMEGDSERALAAGFTAYLTKPFRLDELRALVARLLDEPNYN